MMYWEINHWMPKSMDPPERVTAVIAQNDTKRILGGL